MEKKSYTEEEQQKAIDEIVNLLNKYDLTIQTEQLLKIVPTRKGE